MRLSRHPGAEAVRRKGRLRANKWLLLRRFSQLFILALFMLGPWFGIWIVKGNLNSSLTLEILPLTDPYLLLQILATGHLPVTTAFTGAVIVLVFYLLVGGRVYCSWVCPVNIVTDAAQWLREKINLRGSSHLSRNIRYWLLASTFVLAAITGTVVWETVNPVSMLHRGIIFGMGSAWMIILAVFLLDFLVSRRAWCGHLCPVGAFYTTLTTHSFIRVRADARDNCNDCMDCFIVCPEQQVIRPALKGEESGIGPVITSASCTNCGRCIDVCSEDVFHFGTRLNNRIDTHEPAETRTHDTNNTPTNHSSGAGVL